MNFNKNFKKGIVLGFIAVVIIGLVFLARNQNIKEPEILKIGKAVLNIEVADTDAARMKGLSGRNELEENEGLLFVFEKEGFYGFWMKDMNFPIDIAWLDKNKQIIYIEKDVLTETYPKIFNPPALSLYVLETKANFFENSKIKIGDVAEF